MVGGDALASGKNPNASASRLRNPEVATAPEVAIQRHPEIDKPVATPAAPASKVDTQPGAADAKPASLVVHETSVDEGSDKLSSSADESAASDAAEPEAEQSGAETPPPSDEPGGYAAPGSAVDTDHAADQFAQVFEYAAAGDVPDLQKDLAEFEARESGDRRERELEQSLRMRVENWIAALPPNLAPHVLLVSVECRIGACRLLIAQSGVVHSYRTSVNELMTAVQSLLDPAWLGSLGVRYVGLSVHPGAGGPADTALWMLKFATSEK